jgi:hypothetical protein
MLESAIDGFDARSALVAQSHTGLPADAHSISHSSLGLFTHR